MTEPTRPVPIFDEADTAPFWEGTRDRQLRFQRCNDCDTVIFHPRRHCVGCLGHDLIWHDASGQGTVYSYSIVRQSYHPFFRQHVPYVVAWVDLDEGPRLLSNVVGIGDPSSDVHCGMAVRVEWEPHGDYAIPLFRPL